MRVLGLDYGDKTVGVAVSDRLLLTAQGLEIIRRNDEAAVKKTLARLAELMREYEVTEIVLGYPKNMDNTEGFRCQKTLAFKERLERRFQGVPVILWDERLSTVGAARGLDTLSKERLKNVIDKMAAVFILQGYLDKKQKEKHERSEDFEQG